MTLARVEKLARGHVLGEGSHSLPGGIVVELEKERSLPPTFGGKVPVDARRSLRRRSPRGQAGQDVGAEASVDVGGQKGKTVLLVSCDDKKELQTIEAFISLLQERLAARQTTELERLIEILEVVMPALSVRPHPAVVEQACRNVEFRVEFLRQYDALDAGQVNGRCRSKTDGAADLADEWRDDGKIFGVERQGRVLYPAFQFDGDGRPKPVVAEVLQALGKRGPWQIASWFATPNGWLSDDRRPVDVMDTDPDAVVNAAREVTRPNLF